MQWIDLNSPLQLDNIRERSFSQPQVIFKHSTRCSISSMAKSRLERSSPPPGVDFYFLDLISHRNLSTQVAEDFNVWHESPQVIMIVKGECMYDESHSGISMEEIRDSIPKQE
jgi:monothiol bacilliredoxin